MLALAAASNTATFAMHALAPASSTPVLFSPGLYGTMPRMLYGEFLTSLTSRNISVLTVDAIGGVVNTDAIEQKCQALGFQRIGLLTHSSFDPRILESPYISSAMLCDPVVLPRPGVRGFRAAQIRTRKPVLVTRATDTYMDASLVEAVLPARWWEWRQGHEGHQGHLVVPRFVPRTFNPDISGDRVTSREFHGIGHADILDDSWVDAVVQRNTVAKSLLRGRETDVDQRAAYRTALAEAAAAFFDAE